MKTRKTIKIILAILGGLNQVMNFFIPIAVAMLIIQTTNIGAVNSVILLSVAIAASVFRGIKLIIE